MFSLSDYRYSLPVELIAQEAIHPHHNARMMVIDRDSGDITAETTFWNLDTYLGTDRVIFFNNSRVVRSRITLKNTPYTKPDGTEGVLVDGEIFYLSTLSDASFEAMVRPGKKFQIGTIIKIGIYTLEVVGTTGNGRILQLQGGDIVSFLECYGSLPLPPYIEYNKSKEVDYQTSFAKIDGSVAAPTASLHFTEELIRKIKNPKEYLTLHVGLGTFKGIQTPDIRDYNIHKEKIQISFQIFDTIAHLRENNQKIVAVGTTATRTLESLPYLWRSCDPNTLSLFDAKTRKYWDSLVERIHPQDWIHNLNIDVIRQIIHYETSIYITPGYKFYMVDDLITNFHLGESSLLVLIAAFLGYTETMEIYKYAVKQQYRFYSFGDGMYIRRK